MALMHKLSLEGVEASLDLEDHHASITFQIDGGSHWATLTLQRDQDIKDLKDWLVEYCLLAQIR
jgi:hypothetical protein